MLTVNVYSWSEAKSGEFTVPAVYMERYLEMLESMYQFGLINYDEAVQLGLPTDFNKS